MDVEEAARLFADTWLELFLSLPDDYDCTMTCLEADRAADLYRALGDEGTAEQIVKAHAAHDEPGDGHYQGEQ